ncbi:hypothetical protein [Sphingobium yanoikuyae]|nr:hypothetical protein [Sphingobium yanoikuyae]
MIVNLEGTAAKNVLLAASQVDLIVIPMQEAQLMRTADPGDPDAQTT